MTGDLVVALVAQTLVGVGTSLLTTSLLPAFVTSTPPGMLARFQSLLGLAQTGPVLLATPSLGFVAERAGVEPALAAVAVLLALTAVPAARLSVLTAVGERDGQERAESRPAAERSPTA
ncbi:hypothetical protein ACT8ZV_16640 [Nocardioides sp. MAHUQ-72]|uniref:hypothetical protein n=1 Tax=unclassified Nocardioides TaxID=2615069 RepID=UPI0036120A15